MEPEQQKNYLYAIIKIPVEVLPNGSINSLQEYASVEFAPCDALPKNPIIQNINFSEFFSNRSSNTTPTNEVTEEAVTKPSPPPPTITQDEILAYRTTISHKPSQNFSFKNKQILAHNHTARKR
jgi:hypothetical protein